MYGESDEKDTYALREMFHYSSLAEKPLNQWEIAKHWRAFQIQDKGRHCDPHLDQTKFNDLLPLTIDGVLVSHMTGGGGKEPDNKNNIDNKVKQKK